MDWKYDHCYGKGSHEEVLEGDHITAVDYDTTGQLLAFGDRAGRITILRRWQPCKSPPTRKDPLRYTLYTQFQSHEPQFDCLKSVEIEERINRIKWLKRQNAHHMLLATNDKTIKLWKVRTEGLSHNGDNNLSPRGEGPLSPGSGGCVSPRPNGLSPLLLQRNSVSVPTSLKRQYASEHAYHINSIWPNVDSQSFLSADDLRVNIWHLDQSAALNVVDLKPENMEDLCEVITSAAFHPGHCSLFIFSTSKGSIKMGDLRASTCIQNFPKVFEIEDDPAQRNFFTEIIGSISDCKLSNDGRFILARDYLTLKIWDVNMERMPLKVISLHEPLRKRLCDLYENDCIFDKFECTWSADGQVVATGSYRNHFKVKEVGDVLHQASRPNPKTVRCNANTFEAVASLLKKSSLGALRKLGKGNKADENYDKCVQADFMRKALHLAFHPEEYEVAFAAQNTLGLFTCEASK